MTKVKHLTVKSGEYHSIPEGVIFLGLVRVSTSGKEHAVDFKVKDRSFKVKHGLKGNKCKVAITYMRAPKAEFIWPFPEITPREAGTVPGVKLPKDSY